MDEKVFFLLQVTNYTFYLRKIVYFSVKRTDVALKKYLKYVLSCPLKINKFNERRSYFAFSSKSRCTMQILFIKKVVATKTVLSKICTRENFVWKLNWTITIICVFLEIALFYAFFFFFHKRSCLRKAIVR